MATELLAVSSCDWPALLRRGTARVNLKEWNAAEKDFEELLKLEPKNKKAQEMLKQAREEIAKSADSKPKKKGRKVQIEEEEEEEEEEAAASLPTSASSAAKPKSEEAPMPADVLALKEKGNDMFRRGQYAAAVEHYSTAILTLETGRCGHAECGRGCQYY